jgi:hypothetical protein
MDVGNIYHDPQVMIEEVSKMKHKGRHGAGRYFSSTSSDATTEKRQGKMVGNANEIRTGSEGF